MVSEGEDLRLGSRKHRLWGTLDVCTLVNATDTFYRVGIFAFPGMTEEQANITRVGNYLK